MDRAGWEKGMGGQEGGHCLGVFTGSLSNPKPAWYSYPVKIRDQGT